MTGPRTPEQAMSVALDLLGLGAQRIGNREQVKRDAVAALLNWRRIELGGASLDEPAWFEAIESLRDFADRLIEGDAYTVTLATSQAIVRERVEVFDLPGRDDLPCGHDEPCVECTPDAPAWLYEGGFESRPEFNGGAL
jgi:hypothetical protein